MTVSQRPTDVFKLEHQEVLKKLDALENIFSRLDERGAVAAELGELAAFFKTDFWLHFIKEEEALFPEMEKFIPRESGPIAVMLAEHEDLRSTNDNLQQYTADYLSGSDKDETKRAIQGFGSRFIGTLREHIDKEDNILFQMADMHLDNSQIDAIISRFHKLENS